MEKNPDIEGEKIYEEKFKNLLSPENSYTFFLKMQFILPKYGKEPEKIYFNFVSFILRQLTKNNDLGSIESILDLSLKIYKENHNVIENPEFFVSRYHNIFKLLPVNVNKTAFKFSFLEFCDKSKVPEDLLYKQNIYLDYANDSIENKYFIQGYRFAMKSKNIDLIFKEVNSVLNSSELCLNDIDKVYVINLDKSKDRREVYEKALKNTFETLCLFSFFLYSCKICFLYFEKSCSNLDANSFVDNL
jgi:hypothetical protein